MAARSINTTLTAALLAVMWAIAALAPAGYSEQIEVGIAPAPLGGEETAPDKLWGQQESRSGCPSSFKSVKKCMGEVLSSLLNFRVPTLGSTCCHAIHSFDKACWPKSAPFNPFNPAKLKDYCAHKASETPSGGSHRS